MVLDQAPFTRISKFVCFALSFTRPPWIVPLLQARMPHCFSFQLGAMRITQLHDGVVDHAPAHGFFGVNADDVAFTELSRTEGLDEERFDFPATITLVEVDGLCILIDAGHGSAFLPSAGLLLQALAEAGKSASSIDMVIITHLHRDHIGGLIDSNGKPIFHHARHFVRQSECEHWLDAEADCRIGQLAQQVMGALGDRLHFAEPGTVIAPGMSLLDSAGHTPGHMSVELESAGERMIVAGDLANHPIWSIMRPNWHMSLDWDGQMAAITRNRLLGYVADENVLFAGYHMPFPAVGHIQRLGGSFRYVPLAGTASAG